MPLTGTVDAANARVDLFIDYTTELGTFNFGTLYRRVGAVDAELEFVRGFFGTALLGGQAYVSDHEAPLDVQVWYIVASGPTNVAMTAGPFVIPSNGYVWLKDPGRPWADLRLDLCATPSNGQDCGTPEDALAWVGFGDRDRAEDAGLFPILNKERPADVYARRKDIVSSAAFLSRTIPAIDSVYELFTAGGPIMIQVASLYGMDNPYGITDRYWQPAVLKESLVYQDQRKPWRRWSVPVTCVDQPIGEPQGTDDANWCVIEETYPTFDDLTNTGYSWGSVANGTAGQGPPPSDGYGEGLYGTGPYGDGG
jgi:hypothetical protein